MIPYGFTRYAKKLFLSLPKNIQQEIIDKLEHYLDQSSPLSFAKRLAGITPPAYRFRVGDYRIIFELRRNEVLVLKVGHRKDIYN